MRAIVQAFYALHVLGAAAWIGGLWPLLNVKVKKADVAGGTLTISHGAISKIHMPAMTMTFPVTDPTHLQMLHKGDPVQIEVANQDGTVRVIDFKMQH
nr:copper-binding protein [Rhodoblastus acidophilus]